MLTSEQFREMRRAAGLSQSQMASRLGTTKPQVAAWETGRKTPPQTRSFARDCWAILEGQRDRLTAIMDKVAPHCGICGAYRRLLQTEERSPS